MATSGTTTYSVTELDIYEDALMNIGIATPGEPLKAHDVKLARRKLNMLMKQWVGQADFAPGLKMWTRRRGYLFLQKGQIEYEIAVDKGAESYVSTTIGANEAAGQTTITLASSTGISATNIIGIELDTGYIQWTTVSSVSAPDVVIGAALTSAAGAGNRVFAYATTATLRNPFEIVTASIRDTNGLDTPMDVRMLVEEYESIPKKSTESMPTRLYFEPKLNKAKVFLDYSPDDVSDVIRLVYNSYIEDLTATTQDVDFPQEWFRPLSSQLSMDLCPAYEREISPTLKAIRDESLMMARNAHPAQSVDFYQPEPDCY